MGKKKPQRQLLRFKVSRKPNVAGSEKTEREIQVKTPLNLENFHTKFQSSFPSETAN